MLFEAVEVIVMLTSMVELVLGGECTLHRGISRYGQALIGNKITRTGRPPDGLTAVVVDGYE